MAEMTHSIRHLLLLVIFPLALNASVPKAGESAPNPPILTSSGTETSLYKVTAHTPTILIFYRGSWCPYCNKHLQEIAAIASDLQSMGYQIIALSPDSPENIRKHLADGDLDYRLYSDSSAKAAEAFGLAFVVDEATREKYRGYGIDLEKASGKSHHKLPVPAAFVINASGVIQYSYVNEDYKDRVSGEELLLQARKALD